MMQRTFYQRIIGVLDTKGFFNWMSDKSYIRFMFRVNMKKRLNLKNPETFNEKLQWLKLYDRKSVYSTMVDKAAAKDYVASIIGDQYIIPTLGIWDRFEDIDFDALPDQFVLKCTHDSGGLVICKDKNSLDLESARNKINRSLKKEYYLYGREWPYKNVKPRIIAEQYMHDESGSELTDYKLHCFNGNLRMTLVCTERFTEGGLKEDFYDEDWTHMDLKRPAHSNSGRHISRPQQYDLMRELAAKLSENIPFSRIDFYEIGTKVYFGEITFFPLSGFQGFEPEKWDLELGNWIKLPEANGGGI